MNSTPSNPLPFGAFPTAATRPFSPRLRRGAALLQDRASPKCDTTPGQSPGLKKIGNHGASNLILALAASVLLTGCYDGQQLIAARHDAKPVSRLEEVDLGVFQATLPHTLGEATDEMVHFHAFGNVASTDRHALEFALKTRGPEIRARMLVALRGMNESCFGEAELTQLRKNIAQVINGAIGKELVKSVGFYQFDFGTI